MSWVRETFSSSLLANTVRNDESGRFLSLENLQRRKGFFGSFLVGFLLMHLVFRVKHDAEDFESLSQLFKCREERLS